MDAVKNVLCDGVIQRASPPKRTVRRPLGRYCPKGLQRAEGLSATELKKWLKLGLALEPPQAEGIPDRREPGWILEQAASRGEAATLGFDSELAVLLL